MENCVEINEYSPTRKLVIIKEPGTPRDARLVATKFIQCSVEEAEALKDQLEKALRESKGVKSFVKLEIEKSGE